MLTRLLRLANTIRALFGYLILIAIAVFVIKVVKYFGNLYDSKPIVQVNYKPSYRPEPDTVIKYLEKIKQVKVQPEIIYDTVYYDVSYNHLIKMLKADGNKITIQTQFCGEKSGKEFIYPYTPMFQVVPSDNGIHFTKYKDYWDWNKFYFGYSSACGPEAETRLLFKPLNLEGSFKASFKEIEGKILWRVF